MRRTLSILILIGLMGSMTFVFNNCLELEIGSLEGLSVDPITPAPIPPPPPPPVPGVANFNVSFPNKNMKTGELFSKRVTANPANYTLTCDCPGWLSFSGYDLKGTPTAAGTYNVRVWARYTNGVTSIFKNFKVFVTKAATPPPPPPPVTSCNGKAPISVIIDTDLGVKYSDPDDIQSFVHFMHQTDCLDPLAFVSSMSRQDLKRPIPSEHEKIKEWIRRVDLDHLRKKKPGLISEAEALSRVFAGNGMYGPPPTRAVTAGSNEIIKQVLSHKNTKGCSEKVWILVWGAITTTAKALHQNPSIASCIAIYQIGNWNISQDTASNDWIFNNFNNIFWIQNNESFKGMYLGREGEFGNHPYGRHNFINAHIRGKGTVYMGQKLGDAVPYARNFNDMNIFKAGDDPSWLYLLSDVRNKSVKENPGDTRSWGGSFSRPYPTTKPLFWRDVPYARAYKDHPHIQSRVNKHKVEVFTDVFLPTWRLY